MSVKPVIYCANVSEFDLKDGNEYTKRVEDYAKSHGAQTVIICARIEEEISTLEPDEKELFLALSRNKGELSSVRNGYLQFHWYDCRRKRRCIQSTSQRNRYI